MPCGWLLATAGVRRRRSPSPSARRRVLRPGKRGLEREAVYATAAAVGVRTVKALLRSRGDCSQERLVRACVGDRRCAARICGGTEHTSGSHRTAGRPQSGPAVRTRFEHARTRASQAPGRADGLAAGSRSRLCRRWDAVVAKWVRSSRPRRSTLEAFRAAPNGCAERLRRAAEARLDRSQFYHAAASGRVRAASAHLRRRSRRTSSSPSSRIRSAAHPVAPVSAFEPVMRAP